MREEGIRRQVSPSISAIILRAVYSLITKDVEDFDENLQTNTAWQRVQKKWRF